MLGIGIGVDWSTRKDSITVGGLIASFKARVFANTGTYSAEACQIATLTALNNI
jgi:hypothetical protein